MEIAVKLFGPAAQRVAAREVRVTLNGERAACAALKKALAQAHPALAEVIAASRLAVNYEFAADDDVVSGGDEVALIAMVSGG